MTAPLTIVANEPVTYLGGLLNFNGERWSAGNSYFVIKPDTYGDNYNLIDVSAGKRILESTTYERCTAWLNDPERPWNWETAA